MQFGIGGGTDAGRIAQAHIFASGGEIEVKLLVEVGGVAFEVECAASGMGGKRIYEGTVASEHKRAVEFAQAAGQPGIGKRTTGDLKAAMRKGIGESTADLQVQSGETGGGNVGIEAGEQFEVKLPIGREIEFAVPRELHGAMRREVSSFPDKVELLDVDRLIGEREENGILVMDLSIRDIERNGGQIALQSQLPGLAEWAAQIERTANGGMPSELAAEIGAPESVKIELLHFESESAG